LDPGSFRDPDSRVFHTDDGVLRALSEQGLADWNALASSAFFGRLVADRKIVATELLDTPPPGVELLERACAGVLRHERVPFVSYPYEWTFGMLRDAALLQLDLLLAALGDGMTLKDASPYNVQWRGAEPVFIDVGSFERLRESEPWAGYRQFCALYLYPLLLQAYKNIPFQPWLRGSLEGIEPREARRLLSLRDRFRRGVLTHVVLHARLEKSYAGEAGGVRRDLRAAGFRKELLEANAQRLRKLVAGLAWEPEATAWSGYRSAGTYTDEDAERKDAFVRAAVADGNWHLVWDLGANDGRHARIAAESAHYVVALDRDPAVVDGLYRVLKDKGATSILPLVFDVADPSPALGWRGLERKSLPERGKPELTLCLALLHHLAITDNVPVRELLGWLRSLGTAVVIELVTREDPMAQRLLAAKRAGAHPDYERDAFERRLKEAFDVRRSEMLSSGNRVLYFATPRA
jgi:hypothetical protein